MNPDSDRSPPSVDSSLAKAHVQAEAARVAAELAELGEPELDTFERGALGAEHLELGDAWASEDRSFVEMLDQFSAPLEREVEFDALGQRRAWSKIESHANPDASARRRVVWAVVIASAAALALVVWGPGGTASGTRSADAEAMVALRAQAHAGLEALGVDAKAGADALRVRKLLAAAKGQG